MSLTTLLDMARAGAPERVAIGARRGGLTYDRLGSVVDAGARALAGAGAGHVVFVGVNGPHWPVVLLAAARAGVPVAPLNYRLPTDQLAALTRRLDRPYVIADPRYVEQLTEVLDIPVEATGSWVARAEAAADPAADEVAPVDGDRAAVVLFTSGTSSAPKGVVLRHSHLLSYVIQTVEFGAAGPDEAALVSVPPYHVAGVGTVLTNLYAGRRLVYLDDFTPEAWLDMVRAEAVTHAMVVPTMLARVVDHLDGREAVTPTLAAVAYGGAAMPRPVLERALRLFPRTGFTNSYGLTETSSTVAVLGPREHRDAIASTDPAVRDRLGSVGRPVPGIEASIRDDDGRAAPVGAEGELWLRGAQVSGEYLGDDGPGADGGWFRTRDRARLDADGYLYVLGRMDDTIIRGGENIAPAEIESVLVTHPAVRDAAVVGLPDEQWGQSLVAVVTLHDGQRATEDDVRGWVRQRLRGSRTPDRVVFRPDLPYSPLGKLLRRVLVADLARPPAAPARR